MIKNPMSENESFGFLRKDPAWRSVGCGEGVLMVIEEDFRRSKLGLPEQRGLK